MSRYYLQLEDEIKIEEDSDFDDEDLVLKSLENPRLFEHFVDKYRDVFIRTAYRVLKSREEAENVTQDAFVKIYFNARKYQKRPGIKFKSWAFRILMNCSFTRYRKMKKTFGDAEYMDELLYLRDKNADMLFKKQETRDEIESVLKKMPEDLSNLMKEHYLNDKAYVDIASEEEITIPALKMKLFRARKKFKGVMEKMNNE